MRPRACALLRSLVAVHSRQRFAFSSARLLPPSPLLFAGASAFLLPPLPSYLPPSPLPSSIPPISPHPARLYRRLPAERRTEGRHEQTTNSLSSMLLARHRTPPPRAAAELANNSHLRMASKMFVVFLSFVLLNASMAGFTLLSPNSRSIIKIIYIFFRSRSLGNACANGSVKKKWDGGVGGGGEGSV
jgi:hypothetical protein